MSGPVEMDFLQADNGDADIFEGERPVLASFRASRPNILASSARSSKRCEISTSRYQSTNMPKDGKFRRIKWSW